MPPKKRDRTKRPQVLTTAAAIRTVVAAVAVVGERARLHPERERERELCELVRQGASDVARVLA